MSLDIGKGVIRRLGSKVAMLFFGVQLAEALQVAEKIDATVLHPVVGPLLLTAINGSL